MCVTLMELLFDFRTFARIDGIPHHKGSSVGKLDITIFGAGFPTDISVYSMEVDGALCTIIIASYSEVVCRTSASEPSESRIYSGNAGLCCQYWDSQAFFQI